MANGFICGGEKYQLAGQTGNSIILPVAIEGLPPTLEIEGYTLILKTNFHVTLVPTGKIIKKYGISIPNFLEKVNADFCDFVERAPADFLRYQDEFRFVSENERRTVIVTCDISNLNEFFSVLNKKYGLQIEIPPTHVTLYTLQPDLGIYLIDSNDLETLTKTIPTSLKL